MSAAQKLLQQREIYLYSYIVIGSVSVYRGANKSLARLGRKQATATKL